MPITKAQLTFLISLWFIIAGCAGPITPTATPVVASASPTATATPLPTATFSPTATPAPALTPTPTIESRWECYQGGVACYDFLFAISMLNAKEGWAVGDNSVVLRYTTLPEQTQPIWQQVQAMLPASNQPLWSINTVSVEEWWAVNEVGIVHYKAGEVEEFAAGRLLDLAMTGPDEGWAVGRDGLIVHYQNGHVEKVDSPTDFQLQAIEMVSTDEGWAAGEAGVGLLHYHNQVWEQVQIPDGSDFLDFNFTDVTVVNDNEVWAVGKIIARYKAGQWDVAME